MNEQIDAAIPVLTDVIAPDEVITESGSAPKVASSATEIVTPPILPTAASPPTTNAEPLPTSNALNQTENNANEATRLSAEDMLQLEQSVKEAVLKQVLSRIDFVLEHRVSDSLAEVLQVAVDRLADDIRLGLKHSLEELVTRAVTQELNKIKLPKSPT